MRSRLLYALFGVLATLVGMATGHLVASLLNPASSPVLAVGSQVIDLTPTPLKEYAIRQFGSNDKRVLIGSVMGGVVVLAAIAGLLARRRFRIGAAMLLVLVGVAAFTALNRPAAELLDVLPSLATALAGVGALWLLDRQYTQPAAEDAQTAALTTARPSKPTGWSAIGGSWAAPRLTWSRAAPHPGRRAGACSSPAARSPWPPPRWAAPAA